MSEVKRNVGLKMLAEVRQGDFDAAYGILSKVLANIAANPDEPKYRRLRTSNAKISNMLATSGSRALLVGCGFVEESDALVLPEGGVEAVAAGLSGLQGLNAQRAEAENAQKQEAMSVRALKVEEEAEKRKALKLAISDDTAARKEPGWKAKAAGVKDGAAITTASDIGASGSGG